MCMKKIIFLDFDDVLNTEYKCNRKFLIKVYM